MRYLLDTNTCIRYLNGPQPNFARKLAAVSSHDVLICDVVKAELYFGAYNSVRVADNLKTLRSFFDVFPSLPLDDQAAEIFGRIRAQLKAAGTPIGPYDLQIAAIALANGVTLVTHNTAEFSRIAGLTLADWE